LPNYADKLKYVKDFIEHSQNFSNNCMGNRWGVCAVSLGPDTILVFINNYLQVDARQSEFIHRIVYRTGYIRGIYPETGLSAIGKKEMFGWPLLWKKCCENESTSGSSA